jgi:hypothetical protein
LLGVFAVVVVVSVLEELRAYQSWGPALRAMLMWAIVLLFVFGLCWLWNLFEAALDLRAYCGDPELRDTVVFRLDHKGITATTRNGATTTFWHAVEHVIEDREHLFIYLEKTVAHILPRRVFADEQQFEVFVDTARRYHRAARQLLRTEAQA